MRGCRDIQEALARRRRELVNAFANHVSRYAFDEIETPILEHASLYTPLGNDSDIVSGEMYTVKDTNPTLVLRPEGTAGVARAIRGDGKVWYAGPMFRRERPQRARYRQFWQMGVEAIGDASVTADVDVIEMADVYLREFANVKPVLRVNTLGTKEDRVRYNTALRQYLIPRKDDLSDVSRKRLETGNVMRVLDSKLQSDIVAIADAPSLYEFVSDTERARFEEVKGLLTEADVTFHVDETLVRGLDYYTSTAFEFDGPCGRAICAGGRYDGVSGLSGVGFAIGLDRIEGTAEEQFAELTDTVVVIGLDDDADKEGNEVGRIARDVARGFRRRGYRVVTRLGVTRLSKSISKAVKTGASVVVVIGQDEIAGGFATVKFVRRDCEERPVVVGLSDIFETVSRRVTSKNHRVKSSA